MGFVAAVQDFKECLDDLEQQVAEFTDEIQQLVGCTSDTTSLEVCTLTNMHWSYQSKHPSSMYAAQKNMEAL